ncbi:hypothetical protein [Parendozoicomonas sp. Alg238-R29]|uniref:hypothetical protein n=1 Tax=Parendozoicomonas sp. Alg238-R29 TaxID=2993446 RepID=UPI00248EC041|nr:hypothetical protein [Parendozoicomonas sp. Alg238-R29]
MIRQQDRGACHTSLHTSGGRKRSPTTAEGASAPSELNMPLVKKQKVGASNTTRVNDRAVSSHTPQISGETSPQTLAAFLDHNAADQEQSLTLRVKVWESAEKLETLPTESTQLNNVSFRTLVSEKGVVLPIANNIPVAYLFMQLRQQNIPFNDYRFMYKGAEIDIRNSMAEQITSVIDPAEAATCVLLTKDTKPSNTLLNAVLSGSFTDDKGQVVPVMPAAFQSTEDIEGLLQQLYRSASGEEDTSPLNVKKYLKIEYCVTKCREYLASPAVRSQIGNLESESSCKVVDTYLDCVLRIAGICKWMFISNQSKIIDQALANLGDCSLPEQTAEDDGRTAQLKLSDSSETESTVNRSWVEWHLLKLFRVTILPDVCPQFLSFPEH